METIEFDDDDPRSDPAHRSPATSRVGLSRRTPRRSGDFDPYGPVAPPFSYGREALKWIAFLAAIAGLLTFSWVPLLISVAAFVGVVCSRR